MKRLQPVIWMKGTFLNAQYLQSQDRFIESNLQFQLNALNYVPWGFRNLTIDQEALSGGNFKIAAASGIFPDGLVFDIPDADKPPAARPLAEYYEPKQDLLDVFLAIPDHQERGLNVAMTPKAADTRYVAEVAMLRDENNGSVEKPVQIARKNFRFLYEGENLKGYASLRVAKVRRTAAGTFHVEPRFVPPLVDYTASDFLVSIARRIVEILAAKSSILAGSRRQRNLSLADFGTSDIANFWLLYTINTAFPILQHIFEVKKTHPEELYRALLALAGSLTTFSVDIHPRDLPRYDHDDLENCFNTLDEKVRELLETVVRSNYVSLPLKRVQPQIYATALADDKYFKDTRMYLAITANMNEGGLIEKAPRLIKVCSANHIEHLVNQALPGVRLTHTPAPPSAIPVKLKWQYFGLNQNPSDVYWETVTRSRNIAAYIPGDFPDPEAELIIVLPE
jgi:type VI secretion system protein ImpJ